MKHIVFSGEPVDSELVIRIYKNIKNVNVYNAYGTTESAIISHWYKIPKLKNFSKGIPVGKELPNVRTILLKENKECRIGESGLAFFSGPQISIGYWNNTFMNNKYFVKNPINLNLNQTIYKAGDILRKDIDGLFYYVGRLDDQIKLRGNRFELGEIENFIKNDENVDECVAIPFSRTNNNLFTDIFLFIKLLKNKDKKYFFNKIAKTLPKYMEPTEIFMQNIDFPRNVNGKIDKKKLLKIILKYLA